jgi:hypothetical protein
MGKKEGKVTGSESKILMLEHNLFDLRVCPPDSVGLISYLCRFVDRSRSLKVQGSPSSMTLGLQLDACDSPRLESHSSGTMSLELQR